MKIVMSNDKQQAWHICQLCGGRFDVPNSVPVEYLFAWLDIEGNVVDPTNLDADYGTLQELADDGWRIFEMGVWTPAQRAQAVQAISAAGQVAAAHVFMLNLATLWRVKNEMQPFTGIVWKNKPEEKPAESLLVT
jgi:hypothetical protein